MVVANVSVIDFILSQGDKFLLTHCDRIFKKGRIPSGKLNNALGSMGSASLFSIGLTPSAEDVLFLVDTTVFGGAREGILVTDKGIYFKNFAEAPRFRKMSEIKKCTAIDDNLYVNGRDIIIDITMIGSSFGEPLAKFIESICTENINLNRIKSAEKDGSNNNESENIASTNMEKTVKNRKSAVVKKSVMEDDTNNIDVNVLPFSDILDYRKALKIKNISEIKIQRRTEYRIFFSNSDAELFKSLNLKQDILIHFVTRMCLDFVLIHNDCNNKYRKLILQDPRTFLSLFETMFNYHKFWVREFCDDLRRDVSLHSSYEDNKNLNSVFDLMALNLLYGEVSSVEKPMLEYSIKRGVFNEIDLDSEKSYSYKYWSNFFKALVELDKSTWGDISNCLDHRILPRLELEDYLEDSETLIHDSIMDVIYKWYDSHEIYMCYYLTEVFRSLD